MDNSNEIYDKREQTRLKHRVLETYLTKWGLKLGSSFPKLWYCDALAGPWKSRHPQYHDTSVYRSLTVLRTVRDRWTDLGRPRQVGAIFVEEKPSSFRNLKQLCEAEGAGLDVRPLSGRFQDHISTINELIGNDPGFIFVDPIGWTEARMDYIAQLAVGKRDVLIRVPSETQRGAGRSEPDIQEGLAAFFGVDASQVPKEADEQIRLYCRQLKKACGFEYAAEMLVPGGDTDRTACWLVVGGRHPDVLAVFRDSEYAVLGREARGIREDAKERKARERAGLRHDPHQEALFCGDGWGGCDPIYRERNLRGLADMDADISRVLAERERIRVGKLWPWLLERHHVTRDDVMEHLKHLEGVRFTVEGRGPRERAIKDAHVLVSLNRSRGAMSA